MKELSTAGRLEIQGRSGRWLVEILSRVVRRYPLVQWHLNKEGKEVNELAQQIYGEESSQEWERQCKGFKAGVCGIWMQDWDLGTGDETRGKRAGKTLRWEPKEGCRPRSSPHRHWAGQTCPSFPTCPLWQGDWMVIIPPYLISDFIRSFVKWKWQFLLLLNL